MPFVRGQACMWAAVGGRHSAFHASCIFMHPAFQPQLRSRMTMISLYFHSTQSASPAVCTMHTAFLHYAFQSAPCILHSYTMHSSHSCVPEGQNCILHSMYPSRHSTKAAFRIRARSLPLLAVQELCIVAAPRRCQAAVPSDVRICSCAPVTDLVCPVARVEANG